MNFTGSMTFSSVWIDGFRLEPLLQVVVPVDQRVSGTSSFSQSIFNFSHCEQEKQSLHRLAMKSDGPRDVMVLNQPLLLVCSQPSVLGGKITFQFVKPFFNNADRIFFKTVVDADFVEPPSLKTSLDGIRLSVGQQATLCVNFHDPLIRTCCGNSDLGGQGVPSRPINETFRRVAPLQFERRVQDGLGKNRTAHEEPDHKGTLQHHPKLKHRVASNKRACRRSRRGSILLEVTYAMTVLTALALILLKLSINITAPRQWTLQQTVTDAYMSFEKALAQRMPLDSLLAVDSPWPANPATNTITAVVGRLPGGAPINGQVTRTMFADPNNLVSAGGSGTPDTNPAGMRVYRFQSLLVYNVGERQYVKSRTVVRSQ